MKKENKKNQKNNIKEVKLNIDIENFKILSFICTSKSITKHEYINSLLEKEFNKINKEKLISLMGELENL